MNGCPWRRCFFGIVTAFLFPAAVTALALQTPVAASVAGAGPQGQAVGVVSLDTVPKGGREMPPVPFAHDVHTKALAQQGKSCESCHRPLSPGSKTDFSYAFLDAKGKSAAELKDLYHKECIGCHAGRSRAGGSAGPVDAQCRSCHNGPSRAESARVDGGFDASLHARHIQSKSFAAVSGEAPGADRCASCHHPASTPLPAGLKADSCRSCHGKGLEKEGMPFAAVAHEKCISCHLAAAATAGKPVGPVSCAGCHDPAVKAAYKKLPEVPRLQAGQPDAVLMAAGNGALAAAQNTARPGTAGTGFPPVPFAHKLHEAAVPSCISCHHNTLQACSTCHTPAGDPKGGNKTLAQVMHGSDPARSCVGCHETHTSTQPQCAGCHSARKSAAPPQCASCHVPAAGIGTRQVPGYSADNTPAEARQGLARTDGKAENNALSSERSGMSQATAAAPETVVIDSLSREFGPSVMPHGRIIQSLADGIARTAPSWSGFHAENATLCQSCHHNSPGSPGPVSASPPRCASCHAVSGPLPQDGRPLLKQAYHQQCMGCHQRMRLEKPADTACSACHAERGPAS